MTSEFDGEKFLRELKKQKYSLGTFASALQKHETMASKSVVWQWTQGSQPSIRYMSAISKVLGKPIENFVRKKGRGKP